MAIERKVEKNELGLTVESLVETTIIGCDVVQILHEKKVTGKTKNGVSFLAEHHYKQGSEWHEVTYDVFQEIETGKLQISMRRIFDWKIANVTGTLVGELKVTEIYDKNGNLKKREEFS